MKRCIIISALAWMIPGSVLVAQNIASDTLEIDEVVITGSKVEVSRKNIPLTVSVVSRQELEKSTESALLPVLSEQIPGLFVTERGVTGFGVSTGSAGQINIRGLGGNPTTQVLILIDGHPQFMGLMGHHLPDALVTSDAERVEVIRGPGSILYGSNAFGGVINIITKKQRSDGIEANARLHYGSFNTQKYMGSAGYKKGGFNVFASVNHDRTNGHRDSSDFNITNGYVKVGYEFNSHFSLYADLGLAYYEAADPGPAEQDTVTGEWISTVAGERIYITRGKTALSLENRYARTEGALKLYSNFGEHDISDGWHSSDQMMGVMLYQGFKMFQGNTLTIGMDYFQYGGKGSPIKTVLRDDDGEVIMPPSFGLSAFDNQWITMSNTAFYVSAQQILFQQLILNGGIRYEMNDTYGSEWIPQFGLTWNPFATTTLKGSVSKGYRPPSIRELYLFPSANDILTPERMVSYEVGWTQRWLRGKMRTELVGYVCDGTNMIVKVPPVAPPTPQYRNTGSFHNKGVEFSLDYNPVAALNLHANYAYIRMREPLPATPAHNLFISGAYRFRKFAFNLKLQHIFNLYNETSGGVEIIERSYQVLNARIAYQATGFLNLYVTGHNLLNQDYQINNGYPMPGATVFAGLHLKLSRNSKQD